MQSLEMMVISSRHFDECEAMKRISLTLADEVADRLELASKRPGANRSAIVDAALACFLNPEPGTSSNPALLRRLEFISRQLDRLDRDVRIVTETLGLYVRYYLTVTPPLPL